MDDPNRDLVVAILAVLTDAIRREHSRRDFEHVVAEAPDAARSSAQASVGS